MFNQILEDLRTQHSILVLDFIVHLSHYMFRCNRMHNPIIKCVMLISCSWEVTALNVGRTTLYTGRNFVVFLTSSVEMIYSNGPVQPDSECLPNNVLH
jgi:hypothetical protein